jgi:hypothetical protein
VTPYLNCKCSPICGFHTTSKESKPLQNKGFWLVEMGGLEPPTPYMRSKCSTS